MIGLAIFAVAGLAGAYIAAARDKSDLSVAAAPAGADAATNIRGAASS